MLIILSHIQKIKKNKSKKPVGINFSKAVRYKINKQKSTVFHTTNGNASEKIKKSPTFIKHHKQKIPQNKFNQAKEKSVQLKLQKNM